MFALANVLSYVSVPGGAATRAAQPAAYNAAYKETLGRVLASVVPSVGVLLLVHDGRHADGNALVRVAFEARGRGSRRLPDRVVSNDATVGALRASPRKSACYQHGAGGSVDVAGTGAGGLVC